MNKSQSVFSIHVRISKQKRHITALPKSPVCFHCFMHILYLIRLIAWVQEILRPFQIVDDSLNTFCKFSFPLKYVPIFRFVNSFLPEDYLTIIGFYIDSRQHYLCDEKSRKEKPNKKRTYFQFAVEYNVEKWFSNRWKPLYRINCSYKRIQLILLCHFYFGISFFFLLAFFCNWTKNHSFLTRAARDVHCLMFNFKMWMNKEQNLKGNKNVTVERAIFVFFCVHFLFIFLSQKFPFLYWMRISKLWSNLNEWDYVWFFDAVHFQWFHKSNCAIFEIIKIRNNNKKKEEERKRENNFQFGHLPIRTKISVLMTE